MRRTRHVLLLILTVFLCSSCETIIEIPKTILGTSTRGLEKARINSVSRVYTCAYSDCYQAILDMARLDEKMRPVNEDGFFNIFQHDRIKGIIVVMGIPGNVDTTEVGIFLTVLDANNVKVEVISKSTSAKKKVAKVVFDELGSRFNQI